MASDHRFGGEEVISKKQVILKDYMWVAFQKNIQTRTYVRDDK
jgi:hypothetical protein